MRADVRCCIMSHLNRIDVPPLASAFPSAARLARNQTPECQSDASTRHTSEYVPTDVVDLKDSKTSLDFTQPRRVSGAYNYIEKSPHKIVAEEEPLASRGGFQLALCIRSKQ